MARTTSSNRRPPRRNQHHSYPPPDLETKSAEAVASTDHEWKEAPAGILLHRRKVKVNRAARRHRQDQQKGKDDGKDDEGPAVPGAGCRARQAAVERRCRTACFAARGMLRQAPGRLWAASVAGGAMVVYARRHVLPATARALRSWAGDLLWSLLWSLLRACTWLQELCERFAHNRTERACSSPLWRPIFVVVGLVCLAAMAPLLIVCDGGPTGAAGASGATATTTPLLVMRPSVFRAWQRPAWYRVEVEANSSSTLHMGHVRSLFGLLEPPTTPLVLGLPTLEHLTDWSPFAVDLTGGGGGPSERDGRYLLQNGTVMMLGARDDHEVVYVAGDGELRGLGDLFEALDVDRSGMLERPEVWALRTQVLDYIPGLAAQYVCGAAQCGYTASRGMSKRRRSNRPEDVGGAASYLPMLDKWRDARGRLSEESLVAFWKTYLPSAEHHMFVMVMPRYVDEGGVDEPGESEMASHTHTLQRAEAKAGAEPRTSKRVAKRRKTKRGKTGSKDAGTGTDHIRDALPNRRGPWGSKSGVDQRHASSDQIAATRSNAFAYLVSIDRVALVASGFTVPLLGALLCGISPAVEVVTAAVLDDLYREYPADTGFLPVWCTSLLWWFYSCAHVGLSWMFYVLVKAAGVVDWVMGGWILRFLVGVHSYRVCLSLALEREFASNAEIIMFQRECFYLICVDLVRFEEAPK